MKDKKSLKTEIRFQIYNEYPNWVNGGRAERLAMELGFKSSNASRRCRELENEGIFERRINKGSVEYRYNSELIPRPLVKEKVEKQVSLI